MCESTHKPSGTKYSTQEKMKSFVLLLLIVVVALSSRAITFDTRENLLLTTTKVDVATDAEDKNLSPRVRSWKTRDDAEVEQTQMAKQVFSGFEQMVHPIFQDLIRNHPKGQELMKLHDAKKVQVFHYMIPMRDGARMSTYIINPYPFDKRKSAMISRSPYSMTSDQIADVFTILNGMTAVLQSQRGSGYSEGEFSMWQSDGEDGYDTLKWIADQPWSNGKVFSAGISADGCGTAAMLLTRPAQLKGQLIMWSSIDAHETIFPGGVFREGLVAGWMTVMAANTRGVSLTKTLPDILAHEELSDWWSNVEGIGRYDQVAWPTVHISAWWDIFQVHHIEMFNGMSQNSRDDHYLITGPLGHCLLGNLDAMLTVEEIKGVSNGFGLASELFGDDSSDRQYRNKLKKINVYVQGSRREGKTGPGKVGNYWSSFDSWPKTQTFKLMLTSKSKLSLEKTSSNLRATKHEESGYSEFSYNPIFPMFTIGGNNLFLMFMGMGCASDDQRMNEIRSDVLTFSTAEALTEPLAISGRMKAVLYVSTDREDSDFYVSVNDVHPNGASMQIRYGIRRMRWRNSTPFESVQSETIPDKVYRVEVDLWFTTYVVASGHKLRVMIGSANTPFYAKNDNSGKDPLGFKYDLVAKNRVYFSHEHPSHVELPIVSLNDLPENKEF